MKNTAYTYRLIISPDQDTGDGKFGFTALCPTLGVADGGDSIEEAIHNVQEAIKAYVESLIEDGFNPPKGI